MVVKQAKLGKVGLCTFAGSLDRKADMSIEVAVQALKHFGAIDEATATMLLGMWAHVEQLSPEQRTEVLESFK